MTDTPQTEPVALAAQRQALHEQLLAVTSQGRMLASSASGDEQTSIGKLLDDVRDLTDGVDSYVSELGMMSTADKARCERAERRRAADICQRALSLRTRPCDGADDATEVDLHVVTVLQKAHVQQTEQALARNVCRLSQGLPLDLSAEGDDDEALRTMLISYAPNQGILNIAIDTAAKAPGCKCQNEPRPRQVMTFAMQVEVICRMAVDLLQSSGC